MDVSMGLDAAEVHLNLLKVGGTTRCCNQGATNQMDRQTDRRTDRARQCPAEDIQLSKPGGWLRLHWGWGGGLYCGSRRRRRRVVADGVRISQMDAATTAALGL